MRYLPQTAENRKAMLDAIGVKSVDDLYKDVPKTAFIQGLADLPKHKGELEIERLMGSYANQNISACDAPFFLGAGAYYHHIPSTVDHIMQRSEFLTAYTPYQPEIAQGTLQVIFEFQSMIVQLTGQEVANASLYDGATAMAEAALMALRVNKKRSKIVIGNDVHPHYREVLDSYVENFSGSVTVEESTDISEEAACVIVQSPDFFGKPESYAAWRKQCDETGALLIVVINEIVSLGLLPAPIEADIVCGEAQSIGIPMGFGGPHLGFFACKEKHIRQMPGRLCGRTEDADGKPGFVLTLSTREQHIRREKATSNICTNQGLCALAFTVHLSLLGEDGLKQLARLNHETACKLADALCSINGVELKSENFFNEFALTVPKNAQDVVENLAQKGIIAGYPADENTLIACATEMTTDEDIAQFKDALKQELKG